MEYAAIHGDRLNLAVHLATVPVFMAGNLVLLLTPLLGWIGLAGLAAMAIAIGLQGWTHRREPAPPARFRGPGDFAARILVEQWITFPRYLVTGRLARSWASSRIRCDGSWTRATRRAIDIDRPGRGGSRGN